MVVVGESDKDDGGEFISQRGRQGRKSMGDGGRRAVSLERKHKGRAANPRGGGSRDPSLRSSENRFSSLGSEEESLAALGQFASSRPPQYYRVLPNGDFDTEEYEDEKDWDMDDDPDGDPRLLGGVFLTRGVRSLRVE